MALAFRMPVVCVWLVLIYGAGSVGWGIPYTYLFKIYLYFCQFFNTFEPFKHVTFLGKSIEG